MHGEVFTAAGERQKMLYNPSGVPAPGGSGSAAGEGIVMQLIA